MLLPLLFALTGPGSMAAQEWVATDHGCKTSGANRQSGAKIEWSGLCKNGFVDGNGVVRWFLGGQEIGRDDGEFHGGTMNGKGSRRFDDGDYYEGLFKDGMPSGKGTLRYSHGVRDRYVGEFQDGAPNGIGTLYMGDGRSYLGEFRNGEPIGDLTNSGVHKSAGTARLMAAEETEQARQQKAAASAQQAEINYGVCHSQVQAQYQQCVTPCGGVFGAQNGRLFANQSCVNACFNRTRSQDNECKTNRDYAIDKILSQQQ
jgi:hypothetical protein